MTADFCNFVTKTDEKQKMNCALHTKYCAVLTTIFYETDVIINSDVTILVNN